MTSRETDLLTPASVSSINFYNPLPYTIHYKGKTYKLTPAFDNVLNMYEAISGLEDTEAVEIMLYYLTDGNVPYEPDFLRAVSEVYFPNSKKIVHNKARSFDYLQDAQLIYAAFMQTYGIDLTDQLGKLHWWKFQALFSGLPENTRFSEIVSIRQKPIPKPTKYNTEERANLIRLKQEFKLEISEEERQRNLQEGLKQMAVFLLNKAQKG